MAPRAARVWRASGTSPPQACSCRPTTPCPGPSARARSRLKALLRRRGLEAHRRAQRRSPARLAAVDLPGGNFDAQRVVAGLQIARQGQVLIDSRGVVRLDAQHGWLELRDWLIASP